MNTCMFVCCSILSVAVLQRHIVYDACAVPEVQLFGNPSLLYLPNHVSREVLFTSVDRVAPVHAKYNVVLTDAQVNCSR